MRRFLVVLVAGAIVAPFIGGQVANGVIQAYIPFDDDKNGIFPGPPGPLEHIPGPFPWFFDHPAQRNIDPKGGQPGFGGALGSSPAAVNWCGRTTDCNYRDPALAPIIGKKGVIEFWVSPNWSGTEQGGTGIGGSGSKSDVLSMGGAIYAHGPGLNIGFFNNNWPNDGGQIFASLRDQTGADMVFESNYNGSEHERGTTKYWEAGSWHHIAFSWGADTYALWMDGDRIATKSMDGSLPHFNPDMWLGAFESSSKDFWDGKIDDFVIHDDLKIRTGPDKLILNPASETYIVPTKPAGVPEPATALILVTGGLLFGARRRR